MKLKALLLCAVICCVLLLAACTPNVHHGDGGIVGGTTAITTTPRVAPHTTPHITSPYDHNNYNNRYNDNFNNRNDNFNNRNRNNNPAVGGNTPAAFPYSEHLLRATRICCSDTKIGWGLGKAADSLNRPTDAIQAQIKYGGLGAVFIDDKTDRNIYLTFDLGYENGFTPAILDTLRQNGVKATFFVTYDYCTYTPEIVRRIIAEGHELANHSYSHPSFPGLSDDEIKDEIGLLHDYVKENFGYEMRLIRFPRGEFSERTLAVTQEAGYSSVFWSFAYEDWQTNAQPVPSEAFEKITKASHPGAVYLLHAVSETNAEIMPGLLNYWFGNGFKPSLFA
jgi:peptidoglycan-N-acetylmuramic acid deacetylase